MKFIPLAPFLCAVIMYAGATAHAERKISMVAFTMHRTANVTVSLPQSWKVKADSNLFVPDAPPRANLLAPSGAKLEVSVDSPLMLPPAEISRSEVYTQLKDWGRNYLMHSVENKVILIKMESRNGFGAYTVLTSAKLAGAKVVPQGKYRYLVSGIFVVEGIRIYFDVQLNDLKDPALAEALKAIQEKTAAR